MDLSAIGAKIAAGILPHANDVTARQVRYASGVCVVCDASFGGRDVGVQIFVSGRRRWVQAHCGIPSSRPSAGDARALQDGQGSLLVGGALDNAHNNKGKVMVTCR
jgi:hypothetical protein